MITTCPKCGTDFEAGSLTCMRCGHNWSQRGPAKPLTCAKCKSPYWQKQRIRVKLASINDGSGMKKMKPIHPSLAPTETRLMLNLDGTRKKAKT